MNDSVWTFEELSRDCDGHYCMADGKDYPALCRYEENMTGHPLGDVCGADCMGECSERFCPSEGVHGLIGKLKPARTLRKHRQALRLTLEEVGRRAGLSKGFLSLVENGKARLGLDTAVRLAKAMQISLEELSGMMRNEKQTERTR
jgi:DNA-binding XRE family transcriptional regulator